MRDRISKAHKSEPRFGQPRGARQRAERRRKQAQKPMGGAVRRPRFGSQKAILFCGGVFIQPSSNLFYRKFLKIGRLPLASLAVSRPAARRLTAAQNPQNFFSFSFRARAKNFFN
jgi:hypothetical protein